MKSHMEILNKGIVQLWQNKHNSVTLMIKETLTGLVDDLNYKRLILLICLFSAQKCSVTSSSNIPLTLGSIIWDMFNSWTGFSLWLPPAFFLLSDVSSAHLQPLSLGRIGTRKMEALEIQFVNHLEDKIHVLKLTSSSIFTTNKIWKIEWHVMSLT